jgi:hypothetical protein
MKMINLSNITAGLVAGLVITSVVPALGASRINHSARDARAQAVQSDLAIPGEAGVSGARAKALQDCNAAVAGMKQYSSGVREGAVYRSCMAGHGEVE